MRKQFKVPLYEQKVILVVSKDLPNVAAYRHRLHVPFERHESKAKASGVTWMLPNGRIAVYLPPRAGINVCAHEAMHVAFYMAERLGLDWDVNELLTPEDHKERAYEELAYIVGEVAERLYKLTRDPAVQ